MKHFIALLFIVCSAAVTAQIKKVAFVGNSFTYYNDMPLMLQQIANSMGDSVFWQQSVFNGYTLQDHTENNLTLTMLGQAEWDHVVFQEQSQLPGLSTEIFQNDVIPAAESLCQYARSQNTCVKPIFMMTWGHEAGDADNCAGYPWVCTYDGQQDSLSSRYKQLSEMFDAWCAPAGEVWRSTLELSGGEIDLYQPDGMHPSKIGSYLVACTFYATLFGESPEGAFIPLGVDESDAEVVQSIAANVVLNNSEEWNLLPVVWADMEFTQGEIFWDVVMETAANVDSVLVDDGVSITTWFPNDIGAFTFDPGTHYFLLEVFSQCDTINLIDSLVIETGVGEIEQQLLHIYPNPVQSNLTVDLPDKGMALFLVYDTNGKLVYQKELFADRKLILDMEQLAAGNYDLFLELKGNKYKARFVKE